MSFVSLEFIIFLSIAITLNYLFKGSLRKVVLLFISFYFYSTFTKYSFFIFIFAFVIYSYAIFISFIKLKSLKRFILYLQMISLVIFFIYFKYLGFLSGIVISFSGKSFIPDNPIFSFIGVSYIMFQSIGYLMDVYYERLTVERNILDFSLLIVYFPKLISGPIEKPKNFLQQLNFESYSIDSILFTKGIKYFVYGFFVKSVIADRLSFPVTRFFTNPDGFDSLHSQITVFLYSFQLYTDFMAYSLMALGISYMLGIEIINNFNLPFFSKSISDFWKRWHISLSNWLRDYIFLPLNYSILRPGSFFFKIFKRPEKFSYSVTTLITMLICGIWHGANWTFVLWGLLHGFFMVFGFLTKKIRKSVLIKLGLNKTAISEIFKIVITFILVTFAFIFFRADSVSHAFKIILNIFSFTNFNTEFWFYNINDFHTSIIFLSLFIIFELVQFLNGDNKKLADYLNIYVMTILIFLIIIFGKFGENDFLYFKF